MKSYIITVLIPVIFLTACQTSQKIVTKPEQEEQAAYAPPPFNGPKKKLAIAKFENATRFGKRRLGDNITDVLATELSNSQRFILIERAEVDKILEQVALSQSGLTEGTLEQIQLLDADYILTGTVTKYAVSTSGSNNLFTQSKKQKAEVSADMRMIDVRSGEILLSVSGQGSAEKESDKVLGMGEDSGYDESLEMDAFRAAVHNLTENIVQKLDTLPWVCDVVKIDGSKLYIDAGKKSNLQIGTKLDIYHRGEAIRNLTGSVIGYEEELLGTGALADFFGNDGSIVYFIYDNELQLPLVCRLNQENQP
jgi:curli biogenesis system outer membrane secretion channel CsgG